MVHGPRPLRALKIAAAVLLGAPASMLWMPFMVPFAFYGPLILVRDALAGHFNPIDLRGIAIAIAGTAGLVGFWLWVFDHPRRSVHLQRVTGLLWLAGAVVIGAHLVVLPDLGQVQVGLTVVLAATVAVMGFAMVLRPRSPLPRD